MVRLRLTELKHQRLLRLVDGEKRAEARSQQGNSDEETRRVAPMSVSPDLFSSRQIRHNAAATSRLVDDDFSTLEKISRPFRYRYALW